MFVFFAPIQTWLYSHDRKRRGKARPEARFLISLVTVWGFPISLFWFAFTSNGKTSFWSPVVAGGILGVSDPLLWLNMLNYITDTYPNVAASAVAAFLIPSFALAAGFVHIGRSNWRSQARYGTGKLTDTIHRHCYVRQNVDNLGFRNPGVYLVGDCCPGLHPLFLRPHTAQDVQTCKTALNRVRRSHIIDSRGGLVVSPALPHVLVRMSLSSGCIYTICNSIIYPYRRLLSLRFYPCQILYPSSSWML